MHFDQSKIYNNMISRKSTYQALKRNDLTGQADTRGRFNPQISAGNNFEFIVLN